MSEQAKHTAGPWRLEKQVDAPFTNIGGPIAIVGGRDLCESVEFIVGTLSDCGVHGEAQTEANARLIAAAPELLELLFEALPYIEESEQFNKPTCRTLSKRARAAIAKAGGAA